MKPELKDLTNRHPATPRLNAARVLSTEDHAALTCYMALLDRLLGGVP